MVRDRQRLQGVERVFSCYTSDIRPLMERISVVEGDLLDFSLLPDLLADIKQVYHCAAIVSFNPSERDKVIETNREITFNLVNASLDAGIEKLLHVSSTSAIGESDDGGFRTEVSEWRYSKRTSGYSVSKHESEREAWRGMAEGLKVVIINPAMVLGPGNWGESSTGLVEKCWKGLRFYTEGVNACVDVRDVAEAMTMLMESDISGERFILAAENLSFRSLFEQICRALGKPPPRYRAARWMGELVWRLEWLRSTLTGKAPLITRETASTAMKKHLYSSEKIKEALGFRFRPLSETIEWTCRIFLEEMKQAAKS